MIYGGLDLCKSRSRTRTFNIIKEIKDLLTNIFNKDSLLKSSVTVIHQIEQRSQPYQQQILYLQKELKNKVNMI